MVTNKGVGMRLGRPVTAGAGTPAPRSARRVTTWLVAAAMATLLLVGGATLSVVVLSDALFVPAALTFGVALTVFVLAIGVYVDRRVIGPVQRLTREARRLASGGLAETIHVDGVAEIDELADALNAMGARLRAEIESLAGERHRIDVVLASMADGIVIVDRQMHVQRVNDAAAHLLQVGAAGAVGQTLAAVVRDHELLGILQEAMTSGKSESAVVRLSPVTRAGLGHRQEAPLFVRATGLPIATREQAADPAGLLVLQDVTEVRRTESIRREFVANVSHELRTPLASLKALVETLEEGALEDPPAAREFLAQMHVEVDSLAQMVQELLDLSKIESGQASLRLETVPPVGLAQEADNRMRMQAERAGVHLLLDTPHDLPAVTADPARVVQVLINFLHNAIKFTPAGGTVTLRLTPEPGGVRFAVADSGIGIAPADLPRLFERFYKVDKSRASGGTGLGLAIAKHIIQAHGGRIWAESRGEGQGSTFCIFLPQTPQATLAGQAGQAGQAPLAALAAQRTAGERPVPSADGSAATRRRRPVGPLPVGPLPDLGDPTTPAGGPERGAAPEDAGNGRHRHDATGALNWP